MTDNKPQEIFENVSRQVGKTWTKVQPQLQALLLKLVKALLPLLRDWQGKLTSGAIAVATPPVAESESGETTDAAPSQKSAAPAAPTNKNLEILRGISAQAIAGLIKALTKLQQSLDGQEVVLDETGEPVALLNASTESSSQLVNQVKEEFGIAWKFVKEQVTPKVLEFLQVVVDKLDPIATNVWQKVSTKAAATPSLVKAWDDLQEKDAWKKTVTATAPIWRSISSTATQVPLSNEVKGILDKKAGTIALVTLFSLLILLKPSHAQSKVAKTVAVKPAPIVTPVKPSANQPPAVTDLVKPEKDDVPLTSAEIEIAKIQTQVADVAKQYGEDLFSSVQTDFKRGRLIVALTDSWYQLSAGQKTQLVNDLQTRTRSLNFKKLFVADAANHLIARTPVTGNEIIILR